MEIEKINQHRVSCETIERVDFDALLGGEKAYILYTDPPWSNGNLKYWSTINRKSTNKDYNLLTYPELLRNLQEIIINYVDGFVFIEASTFIEKDLIYEFFGKVLKNLKIHKAEYIGGGKRLPNLIISGGTNTKYNFDGDFKGLFDYNILREVLSKVGKASKIILDPFCGTGLTAKAAINYDMRFIGNDFNNKRLLKTIKILKDGDRANTYK